MILLRDGGLRLVDLGVCRAPHLEDFPQQDIPGTPSYMAPELFQGQRGDEASDLFALGVTVYRMFAGAYPYGEIEPFSKPRFGKPQPLCARRPDLAGLARRGGCQGRRRRAPPALRRRAGICVRIGEWRGHLAAGKTAALFAL